MRKSVDIPGPPPRRPARVISLRHHAGGLFTLTLDAGDFSFTPGDCIAVYGPDGRSTRPYSLSGGTADPTLELLIRRISGGQISDWLAQRLPGETLEITPPFGWFRPAAPPQVPKIYVATGSGIAPFLSAIRSGAAPPLACYWGIRSEADLDGISFPGVIPCISRGPRANGRITGRLARMPLDPQHHYYLCGLDAMIESVASLLEGQGIPAAHIHRECFFTAGAPGG